MIVAELLEVTKRFGSKTALGSVSLAVCEGSVVALLGPNGAGKSTAMAVLVGTRRPDAGVARLFGRDPRAATARAHLGAMAQEIAFPATVRVRELVDLVRVHYERPFSASRVLARFGLEELASRQVGGLSVGERRRVAVALAFTGNPGFVVLDEPTAGLDRETRRAVWEAIREHAERGGAVLLSTHYLEEADALADWVVQLAEGVVVAEGTVSGLKASARTTLVRFRAEPGVAIEDAIREGPYLSLVAADGAEAVDRLVRSGITLVDLEVRPLTLEEALGRTEASR